MLNLTMLNLKIVKLTFDVSCDYREYYPQNIMFDKRVHRGNSYAAMVIPAGTSHDTMIMEKRQTQKAQSLRQRTFKSTAKVS